ncbi:MAG: nitroreductase family protein [Deltaproteobacteria bacterium]|nr:nitroreductase family protein [Deltaproteobacteria bacterium]
MGMISIDGDKCKRDGICVRECPTAIIKLKDKESVPQLRRGGDESCLRCGHCVAVCPHGALSHRDIPLEACPPIEKDLKIGLERVVQLLRSRRSVRLFKDKPVEKEIVQQLIKIARYAPTGSNMQLVEYTVFTDRKKIRQLAGMTVDWMKYIQEKFPGEPTAVYMPMIISAWDMGFDSVLRSAPALIVASAPKENRNGMVDISIALAYLELAALPSGLGTCWAGLLQGALLSWDPLKEAIGLPTGHRHHYPMMIGYAKPKYYRLPERKPPRITFK